MRKGITCNDAWNLTTIWLLWSRSIPLKTSFLKETMWWLVLATGLCSSVGTTKHPWHCQKMICKKLWKGQMGFCLRWITLKSEPQDSQTIIIISVSGFWSANHCIDPYVILGERSAFCAFWQLWLLAQCLIFCGHTGKLPTSKSWIGLKNIETGICL